MGRRIRVLLIFPPDFAVGQPCLSIPAVLLLF